MIKSKLELKFYIASDRIMNGFPAKRNLIQILKEFVSPQKDILRYSTSDTNVGVKNCCEF